MNTRRFLTGSICLNLLLVAAVAWQLRPRRAETVPTEEAVPVAARVPKSQVRKPDASPAPSADPLLVERKLDWRSVESEDYKAYIANLRAVGCPEETIRDIIIADVNKMYASRWRSTRQPVTKDWKYWQSENQEWEYRYRSKERREEDRQRRDLEKEKKALIQELLGIDYTQELRKTTMYDYQDREEQKLGFLPEDKQQQIKAIKERWQKAMQDLRDTAEPGEPWSKEMQQKSKQLQKQQEAEIFALLTPQEKEDYEYRLSSTAQGLRSELTAFEPSEDEFKRLFKLKKLFDEQWGDYVNDPEDEAGQKKWSEAYQQLSKEMKKDLPEERQAEYDRAKDYDYRQLVGLTRSLGLGKESAATVYDTKKAAEDAARKLRNNRDMTEDQRTAALKAIRDETERTLTDALGEKGLKTYKNDRGYWIRSLNR